MNYMNEVFGGFPFVVSIEDIDNDRYFGICHYLHARLGPPRNGVQDWMTSAEARATAYYDQESVWVIVIGQLRFKRETDAVEAKLAM